MQARHRQYISESKEGRQRRKNKSPQARLKEAQPLSRSQPALSKVQTCTNEAATTAIVLEAILICTLHCKVVASCQSTQIRPLLHTRLGYLAPARPPRPVPRLLATVRADVLPPAPAPPIRVAPAARAVSRPAPSGGARARCAAIAADHGPSLLPAGGVPTDREDRP